MPSSYSSNLLLELMADGENEGLWGDITNENLEILGRAAGGVGNITLAGTTHTLTVTQGTLSEGHYSTLVLGGSPTGTNTITINPNTVTRTFLVQNSSGQDAIFTQGSGGNVTVPNGGTAIVFCSGSGASSSVTDITADFLRGVNNLSDLDDPDAALQNLGLTATAAEINKLDGATLDLAAVTATAAEVNVLDGSTATTDDLNKLADVTATADELNLLDGATLEVSAVTATAAEVNVLDGVTATTAELNYTDGVTSPIQDQLDANSGAASAAAPSGAVMAFAMNTAPSGWLKCDGSDVSRTTYASLFSAIGTTFGEGDGSSTFTLPDMRGEFVRGWDDGRGVDSGRSLGSDQLDQLQNITGAFSKGYESGTASGAFRKNGSATGAQGATFLANHQKYDFDASRVARAGDETRPRNVALLYCIKT